MTMTETGPLRGLMPRTRAAGRPAARLAMALGPALCLVLLLASPFAASQETTAPSPASEAEAPPRIEDETRPGLLLQLAMAAYQQQEHDTMRQALERAVQLRPHLADLRFMLARAYALLDRKTDAYNTLVMLDKQGLSFQMDGDADFENLRGFQLYDFLQQQFNQHAQPFGAAIRAMTIDRDDLLLESLAWDSQGGRLLAGSVTTGKIFVVGEDGTLESFIEPDEENGLLGITALAVDAERNALWVASAGTPQAAHIAPGDRGATHVHRFDLRTGKQTARFSAPERPMLFLDLAIAPDGDVFVSDAVKPVVWRLSDAAGDEPRLAPFFVGRGMTGIRSITLDDTGERLYFADYELGLMGIELAEQELFAVHLGDALNLGGVDAIHWFEDSLIVLQNGVTPRRVLRFQLFEDRRRGRHVQALESGNPAFRNPVAGTLDADGRFLLIANSHRNAYDPRSGKALPDAERNPHVVLAVDPGFNWNPPTF